MSCGISEGSLRRSHNAAAELHEYFLQGDRIASRKQLESCIRDLVLGDKQQCVNVEGDNLLHLAARRVVRLKPFEKLREEIAFLVEQGFETSWRNIRGETPQDLIEQAIADCKEQRLRQKYEAVLEILNPARKGT